MIQDADDADPVLLAGRHGEGRWQHRAVGVVGDRVGAATVDVLKTAQRAEGLRMQSALLIVLVANTAPGLPLLSARKETVEADVSGPTGLLLGTFG